MDIRKLQRAIVDGLEDVKGQDIAVFNTEHLSPLFERVVVASGTSNRQTKALASSVNVAVKAAGGQVLSIEGEDNGEWIIVDCGEAVVHVMQPAIRQYYHLEEIWGGKPVKMKLNTEVRGLAKASEPEAEEPPAKKPRGKIPAASQSPLPPEKPAKPARKRAAPTPVVAAPARKTPRSRTAVPATAAAAPAAKKAPARKAPARKIAVPTLVINAPVTQKPAAKKAVRKPAAPKAPRG